MFVFLVNTPAPRKTRYSRKYRLTRETDLEAIKRAGKRLKTEHLEARAATSLLTYCRIAVIVGKYGHTIVERNRLRRRLRELTRRKLLPGCYGLDMVVRALPEAYRVDFEQLGTEIDQIGRELVSIVPQG